MPIDQRKYGRLHRIRKNLRKDQVDYVLRPKNFRAALRLLGYSENAIDELFQDCIEEVMSEGGWVQEKHLNQGMHSVENFLRR